MAGTPISIGMAGMVILTLMRYRMNLDQYQEAAKATVTYPDALTPIGQRNPFYLALGLIGEVHEFESSEFDLDELGDVLWYVAMLATEFGWKLSALLELGLARRDERTKAGYYLKGKSGTAASIAEPIKKLWRDGDSEKHRESIKNALADLMYSIEMSTGWIEQVCDRNIAKLTSRAERGVLHGSGDHR